MLLPKDNVAVSFTSFSLRQRSSDKSAPLSEDGAGEIYAYVPPDPANDHLLDLEGSETDPTIYGLSIARGAFHFARGNWTVVAQRIKLNTFGKADGKPSKVSRLHTPGSG